MAVNAVDYPEDLAARYAQVKAEVQSIVFGEPNWVARLATASCLLSNAFSPRFFWTGFYLVDEDRPRELVVGPYQGTLGCLRIPFGKGVCGACAEARETIVVPDVHAFEGHIACDGRTKSEIVVPVFNEAGGLVAVLDVDSEQSAAFSSVDSAGLEGVCSVMMAGLG